MASPSKDSKTETLKDPSSEQSDDDWKAVLRAVLLADPPPEDLPLLKNIQLSALVKNDSISVSVREDVGGIRRRLGVLQLSPQDVEIELWDWLDRVCKEKDDAEARSYIAERAAAETQTKLEKLEKQVRDLSLAKKKHEDGLILQFQRLLNEKKKKIRELSEGQRRTAVVVGSPSDADEVIPSGPKMQATITGRKRKQERKMTDEREDELADKMLVDQALDLDGDEESGIETVDPEAEDRQTTDDDEGDDDEEEL